MALSFTADGGGFGELFGQLSEKAVDLGTAYAEKELLGTDEKRGAADAETAAPATPAGQNSGQVYSGVKRQVPDWVFPVLGTVGGVVAIILIFKAIK